MEIFRSHLRPISENYLDNSSIIWQEELNLFSAMPTHISNSSMILRRKSTGSSDVGYKNSKSPIPSSASISSEEQIFQRRNSMTTRSHQGLGRKYSKFTKLEAKAIDKMDDSDECYNYQKTKPIVKRFKVKKMSQNSLGSDEMLSSSDEDNLNEDSDDASTQSPIAFEDMVNNPIFMYPDLNQVNCHCFWLLEQGH